MPISSASNSPVTSSTNIVNKATSPNAAPSLCNPGLQGVGTIARPERVVYRVNALFTAPPADGPEIDGAASGTAAGGAGDRAGVVRSHGLSLVTFRLVRRLVPWDLAGVDALPTATSQLGLVDVRGVRSLISSNLAGLGLLRGHHALLPGTKPHGPTDAHQVVSNDGMSTLRIAISDLGLRPRRVGGA